MSSGGRNISTLEPSRKGGDGERDRKHGYRAPTSRYHEAIREYRQALTAATASNNQLKVLPVSEWTFSEVRDEEQGAPGRSPVVE
jgi:hypothetical protein